MAIPTNGNGDGILLKWGAGVFAFIATTVATIMSALFKRILSQHDRDIEDIKKTVETQRKETREADIALHRKVEDFAHNINTKIDTAIQHNEQRHNEMISLLVDRQSRRRSTDP